MRKLLFLLVLLIGCGVNSHIDFPPNNGVNDFCHVSQTTSEYIEIKCNSDSTLIVPITQHILVVEETINNNDELDDEPDPNECICAEGSDIKVTICHKGKTIVVSSNAVEAHLTHGDYVGKCQ